MWVSGGPANHNLHLWPFRFCQYFSHVIFRRPTTFFGVPGTQILSTLWLISWFCQFNDHKTLLFGARLKAEFINRETQNQWNLMWGTIHQWVHTGTPKFLSTTFPHCKHNNQRHSTCCWLYWVGGWVLNPGSNFMMSQKHHSLTMLPFCINNSDCRNNHS